MSLPKFLMNFERRMIEAHMMDRKYLEDLAAAIQLDLNGDEFEVGYTDASGVFAWRGSIDGIGYYLRNLDLFQLRAKQ